jgi:hypothetical protein
VRASGARHVARAYGPALAAGLALASAYLWICARVWYDPLARRAGIDELAGHHLWSAEAYTAADWVERLTWGPPWLFVLSFGAAFGLAAVGAHRLDPRHRVWLVASGGFLLLFWFGSATTRAYEPLPLTARMVVPALPGVLFLAALGLEQVTWRRSWIAVVALALALPYARAVVQVVSRERPLAATYDVVRREVAASPAQRFVIVCGEPRCLSASYFHFGFAPPSNVVLADAARVAATPFGSNERVLVIVDRRLAPDVALGNRLDTLGLALRTQRGPVQLYDARDGAALHAALQTDAAAPAR